MTFSQAAIKAVYAAALSDAKQLGVFEVVYPFEPKAKPVSLPAIALWVDHVIPVAAVSGLASTAGRLGLRARVYKNFLGKPESLIDPELLVLVSTLFNAYSGGFTFGGAVMDVDLLGAHGESLSARFGFIHHDDTLFRVAECDIPVIITDLWTQVA